MASQMDVSPTRRFAAVTKSDTVNFTEIPRALYIGVSGDVVLVGEDNVAVTFKAVPVGLLLATGKRVNSTSTTATDMVALY